MARHGPVVFVVVFSLQEVAAAASQVGLGAPVVFAVFVVFVVAVAFVTAQLGALGAQVGGDVGLEAPERPRAITGRAVGQQAATVEFIQIGQHNVGLAAT